MNPLLHRTCLATLALSGVFVGSWAYCAPLHWYNTFPGFGLRWLPVLGPYNEHFAKDVGAAYLATAVLAAIAFVYLGNRALMLATALTLSTFNLLHLIYHVPMLHMYGPLDAALNAISLSMVLVCSVVIALPVEATADSVTADT